MIDLSFQNLFQNHHPYTHDCYSDHRLDSVVLQNMPVLLSLGVLLVFSCSGLLLLLFTFGPLSLHLIDLYGEIVDALGMFNFVDTSECLEQSYLGDEDGEYFQSVVAS